MDMLFPFQLMKNMGFPEYFFPIYGTPCMKTSVSGNPPVCLSPAAGVYWDMHR